jgi:hypothetical protein
LGRVVRLDGILRALASSTWKELSEDSSVDGAEAGSDRDGVASDTACGVIDGAGMS